MKKSDISKYFIRTTSLTFFVASTVICFLIADVPENLFSQDRSALKSRVTFSKSGHSTIAESTRSNSVTLKFREGTRVRARSGVLVALVDSLSEVDERLLARFNLSKEIVREQIKLVNQYLNSPPVLRWKRLFNRPESELDREKIEGERHSGEELADLNLYYALSLDQEDAQSAEKLIDQLNGLEVVEIAYAEPLPTLALCNDIDPPTPDYTELQGYLNPAPNGIDAYYAWTIPGGTGDGVRIIDVEGGWNLTHESLPNIFFQAGQNSTNPIWRQHGTAVMGEIVGCGIDKRDARIYGVTGIANAATLGVSSIFPAIGYATAIDTAAAQLNAGEIILIELQTASGPGCNLDCTCTGNRYLPTEYDQAVFDVIRAATARDLIVVQAAGNGSNNLDCPAYEGRFERSVRDSGALIVGAGSANGRVPLLFTNYGTRVDVQGWGQSVMSSGYGQIRVNGPDENQWYTAGFSGTSSASPIVTGAVASLQGVILAQGLPPLPPAQMIELLRSTGTPQAEDPRQIGPLPDLQGAISTILMPQELLAGTK